MRDPFSGKMHQHRKGECQRSPRSLSRDYLAVGDGRKSLMLALMRKGILDIPMMFMLLRLIPIYGTVWATPIADVLCCVTAIALLTAFLRALGRKSGRG